MKQIPLSKGHVAFVDAADYPQVSQYKWSYDKNGYAVRVLRLPTGKRKKIMLHRWILNAPNGTLVDHRDGNPLNNTRDNLRLCTHSQNSANRRKSPPRTGKFASRYRGAYKAHNSQYWSAGICYRGQRIYIGSFATEDEAARAYDRKAVELFGEFAVLNFP